MAGSETTELRMDCKTNSIVDRVSQEVPGTERSEHAEVIFFRLSASNIAAAHVVVAPDSEISGSDLAVPARAVLGWKKVTGKTQVLLEVATLKFESARGLSVSLAFSPATTPWEHIRRIQRWRLVGNRLEFRAARRCDSVPEGLSLDDAAVVATNVLNKTVLTERDGEHSDALQCAVDVMTRGWLLTGMKLHEVVHEFLQVGLWHEEAEFIIGQQDDAVLLVTLGEFRLFPSSTCTWS